MKKLIVLIILFSPFFIFAEDEILEIEYSSTDENASIITDDIDLFDGVDITGKDDEAKAKPTFTISLFYPHFMGKAVDMFESIGFDKSVNPGAEEIKSSINGGLDVHFSYVLMDYMLVTAGFSWASYHTFRENSSGVTESDSLFTMFNIRAGVGGVYPIINAIQFVAGTEIGYMHLMESGYIASTGSEYADVSLPSFLLEPFMGFDFQLQQGLSLSLRFDYALAFSGKDNSLTNGTSFFTHYPGVFLGLGFQF